MLTLSNGAVTSVAGRFGCRGAAHWVTGLRVCRPPAWGGARVASHPTFLCSRRVARPGGWLPAVARHVGAFAVSITLDWSHGICSLVRHASNTC